MILYVAQKVHTFLLFYFMKNRRLCDEMDTAINLSTLYATFS